MQSGADALEALDNRRCSDKSNPDDVGLAEEEGPRPKLLQIFSRRRDRADSPELTRNDNLPALIGSFLA